MEQEYFKKREESCADHYKVVMATLKNNNLSDEQKLEYIKLDYQKWVLEVSAIPMSSQGYKQHSDSQHVQGVKPLG
jgi:hypothetical protein